LKSWDDYENYSFPSLSGSTRSSFGNKPYTQMKKEVAVLKGQGYFTIPDFNPGNYYERMQWLEAFRTSWLILLGDLSSFML
jgi:hypothetical protein